MSNTIEILQAQNKLQNLLQVKNANELQLLKLKCDIKEQKNIVIKLKKMQQEQKTQQKQYDNFEQIKELKEPKEPESKPIKVKRTRNKK